MRDILKLDIVLDKDGLLQLKPMPINGIQAELRLSSTPEQLNTLSLLVPEIHSILFKFDNLYHKFCEGQVTTYYMVQDILQRFDTPQDLHNGIVAEDFLLDLTKELHERIGRIEALIPKRGAIMPKNVSIEIKDIIEEEVTDERKASLKAELDKIEGIPQKIRYLQKEKLNYLKNLSGRSLEASGNAIAGGFPIGPLLFDRYIELEIEGLKLEAKSPEVTIDSLIKVELINNRLREIESNLKAKIGNWKQGDDKIECAAFCELLHDLGFFIDKKNNRKGPIQFALIRYGIDITVQMGTSKNKDRKIHKGRLKHYL